MILIEIMRFQENIFIIFINEIKYKIKFLTNLTG